MSFRRKIPVAIVVTIFGITAYFGSVIVYTVYTTVRHIPEAYAAWDTGTLLVEYMKAHDGGWPSSWDELLSVMSSDSGSQIMLRGANADDTNYALSLRKMVAIDWKFDPAQERPALTGNAPQRDKIPNRMARCGTE